MYKKGIICVILGLVIGIVDQFMPTETSIFFGIDPLTESTEKYTSEQIQFKVSRKYFNADWCILESEKLEDAAANKPMDQENAGAPAPASRGNSQTRQFNAEPVKSKAASALK
jgi:hypothetical protein